MTRLKPGPRITSQASERHRSLLNSGDLLFSISAFLNFLLLPRELPVTPAPYFGYLKTAEDTTPFLSTMATSDLDQLIDMGFDKEKAALAVKKTGGCTSLSPLIPR